MHRPVGDPQLAPADRFVGSEPQELGSHQLPAPWRAWFLAQRHWLLGATNLAGPRGARPATSPDDVSTRFMKRLYSVSYEAPLLRSRHASAAGHPGRDRASPRGSSAGSLVVVFVVLVD